MIDPPPFFFICGTTAATPRKTPVELTAMTRSQMPVSSKSFTALPLMPALFTRMSILPHFETVSATTEAQLASSVTFRGMKTADSPIAAATSLPSSSSMSAITTFAPSFAKRTAVARPIPDAAPVTIATLFASRMVVSS